jgi:hypothetical protein
MRTEEVIDMAKIKRLAAALAVLAVVLAPGAVSADPECSPGQQGNQHPGFKPGVCDNK